MQMQNLLEQRKEEKLGGTSRLDPNYKVKKLTSSKYDKYGFLKIEA